MAYKTESAVIALQQVDQAMLNIKQRAGEAVATLASPVTSEYVLNIRRDCVSWHEHLTAMQTTPGIQEEAKRAKNDADYDIVPHFVAVKAKLQQVFDWVTDNFPVDGSGYLLAIQFSGTGETFRSFGTAATAPLRTLLTELSALIEE